MPASPVLITTTLSTKGQVILPKAVRDARHWGPGTRLVVQETSEGVILKRETEFSPSDPRDVFGSLKYKGRPKTVEEMKEGIAREVRRRHERGRY